MASIQLTLRTRSSTDTHGIIYFWVFVGETQDKKSLKIKIPKSQWDKRKARVKPSRAKVDNSVEINTILDKIVERATQCIRQFEAESTLKRINNQIHVPFTAEDVIIEIFKDGNIEKNDEKTFIKYARKYVQSINPNQQYALHRKLNTVVNNFEKFIEEKYGSDIRFEQITISVIKEYITFRSGQFYKGKKISPNTVKRDMKELSSIFNHAMDEEYINLEVSPFSRAKVKTRPTNKVWLNEFEVNSIYNVKLEKGSNIWHVRNYLMFMICTGGVRIGDLCCLQKNHITGGQLYYVRNKTATAINVHLVPQAQEIFEFYNNYDKRVLLFPIMDQDLPFYTNDQSLKKEISRKTAGINKYLKQLARKANISKPLSTHIGRHTFSNMAASEGWSIYKIKDALGHKKIKTTEEYLKTFTSADLKESTKNLFINIKKKGG